MIIETDRLILRPFKEEDINDLFDYLKEPEVNCFMCMKLHNLEDAKLAINERINAKTPYFAIILKENHKLIGEIFAHPEQVNIDQDEEDIDTYSPCWMLNKDYQKKGYAFEAAYVFFDYLFIKKNARRLYAYTEDYNIASQHLCEKLGMRKEGLFLEYVSFVNKKDGTPLYENTYQYAILKKEWIVNKKEIIIT